MPACHTGIRRRSHLCLGASSKNRGYDVLGAVEREVRVWYLSAELIGKVIVTLEKWLQQYCSNTATKLGASARNLTPISLLVVPIYFFTRLLLCPLKE